ncbi:MAG: disulfide bond formation protein B [bacterium]|nr:disulfide bond formation protein B [bacterium]
MGRQSLFFYLAFFLALFSTVGSLVASEIFRFPPCTLCWVQRVFMFPLTIILPIGIIKKDPILPFYVLPLSIGGTVIALYHYLLQMRLIPDLTPCTIGIPCTTIDVVFFGFITLPFLSFTAFMIITACMLLGKRVK